MDHMRQVSQKSINPGKHVSIDKQLILFKGRSKHTMIINSKEAGQGFKLYSLCVGNYLIWFIFTSKYGGIDGLQLISELAPSSSIIVNLIGKLLELGKAKYVVYLDNFFTNRKLLLALRKRGFGACGTCKNGSGIALSLIAIKELANKKNNWGTKALTTLDKQILYLIWQDNNTILLITTAYCLKQARQSYPRDPKKRYHIPDSSYEWTDGKKKLRFPKPVINYNKHMGGSNGNA